MNSPLISIVVPIYKVELYLLECVNSITSQTYKNLEIILVDDGSPDRCPEMCDRLASEDSRIKVIHKANGGLSDARNAGIRAAKGDYVIFIDSDDFWIDKEAIDKLVQACRDNDFCDIVFFGRTTFINSKIIEDKKLDPQKINGRPKAEVLKSILIDGAFVASSCLKLIRRDLIIDNNHFFEKGLLSEDWDWSQGLYLLATTFAAVSDNFYGYRKREGSISNSFHGKHCADVLYIIEKWKDIIANNDLPEEEKNCYLGFLAYIYVSTLACISLLPNADERKNFYISFEKHITLLRYDFHSRVKQTKLCYSKLPAYKYKITCGALAIYYRLFHKQYRFRINMK